jgi:hypothetical protein
MWKFVQQPGNVNFIVSSSLEMALLTECKHDTNFTPFIHTNQRANQLYSRTVLRKRVFFSYCNFKSDEQQCSTPSRSRFL